MDRTSQEPTSPGRHRRAVTAARARWGPLRIVRLDALDPATRAAVLALVEADRAAKVAAASREAEAAAAAER